MNDDKQFYHCFGCGEHGDVIGFVMRHDNLSFPDAIEQLAALAGLQVPQSSPEEIKKAEKTRDLHGLMDSAVQWMQDQLYAPANREILSYVEKRGLSPETIAAFRLGYAPSDRQSLRTHLKAEGFTDKQMIEAGVLKSSDKSREPYAFFRDRVMFPVCDRRGRVVAFGGRALPEHLRPPEKDGFKPPKYINSSDTPLFDKGRTLYAENLARLAAREGATPIVTEGYMDVIACHQAGFRGAVAPMGTALTEEQIVLLWSMIPGEQKIPILCFDGDNAGRNAAVRASTRILPLLKPYHSVRIAFLPDGQDPDSLVKSGGGQAFQDVLNGAVPLFEFLWMSHTVGRTFDTPESRAGLASTLTNVIKTINDHEVQRHYNERLKARIAEVFFSRPRMLPQQGFKPKPVGIQPKAPGFKNTREKVLLAVILNNPQVFEVIEETLGSFDFRDQRWDRVRQEVISALSTDHTLDREALQNHLKSQGLEKETGDILSESVYVHASFARPEADANEAATKLLDWLREIEERNWKDISSGWKPAFSSASVEEETRLKAMMELKTGERGS